MSHIHGGHVMPSTTAMDHSLHNTTTMNHAHHVMGTEAPFDPHAGHAGHGGVSIQGVDHADHSSMGHTMQMYFHTGIAEYILFESALTSSAGGIIAASFAMFVLAVTYEGLKFLREYLLRRAALRETYSPSTSDEIMTKQPALGTRMLSGTHVLQTMLHMVQVFISYCLMLIFMTYNIWLCLAIILGAGLGYFLFGWRRAMVVDVNEHCH